MSFPPYDWAPMPTPEGREYRLKIERAPASGHKDYGILSNQVVGVFLHWDGKKNVGCQGRDFCQWCAEFKGRKWRGYLAARTTGTKYVRLLELTAEQLDGFFLTHPSVEPEELRGLTVRVERKGKGKKSPPQLSLVATPRASAESLPPEPDVKRELHRIWTTC